MLVELCDEEEEELAALLSLLLLLLLAPLEEAFDECCGRMRERARCSVPTSRSGASSQMETVTKTDAAEPPLSRAAAASRMYFVKLSEPTPWQISLLLLPLL
jgi:hypothetical protein